MLKDSGVRCQLRENHRPVHHRGDSAQPSLCESEAMGLVEIGQLPVSYHLQHQLLFRNNQGRTKISIALGVVWDFSSQEAIVRSLPSPILRRQFPNQEARHFPDFCQVRHPDYQGGLPGAISAE